MKAIPHEIMTPEERSHILRAEADEILEMVHLREYCSEIGELIPTGSYFLDLLMYPDIDLYLPHASPETVMRVGVKLAGHDCVRKIIFERKSEGELTGGIYLKPYIEYGDWERPWKIDIWSLPMRIIEEKQAELRRLGEKMTADHRCRILDYKFRVLTDEGRTPMFSGIHICRGIVDNGMKDFDSITEYLREQGIKVQQ
jgi:hypothetical protein